MVLFEDDRPLPCRDGMTSEPILNQYYLFWAEQILNHDRGGAEPLLLIRSATVRLWFLLIGSATIRLWFTYVRIRSRFGSAEPILNQKCPRVVKCMGNLAEN